MGAKKYTAAHLAFVAEAYLHLSLGAVTQEFNRYFKTDLSVMQIRGITRNHNMKSGRTGFFEKGAVSWNAGTKGVMQPNSGNFKKGSIPANQQPIGHERICTKDGYVLIKVDEINPHTGFRGRYRHKHVVIWEKENGPVPDGHVVTFKDGDKTNIDIGNLECIDRNLLCRMNKSQVYDLPKELIPTMKNIVKLRAKIHQRAGA